MRNISKRDLSTHNFVFASAFVLVLLLSLGTAPSALAQTTWSYANTGSVLNVSNSANPLTVASDGNVYWAEDDPSGGSIYQITPAGVATAIYSFNCVDSTPCNPGGPLLQGVDGYLYGTNSSGGLYYHGDFFKIALDGTGLTDLYDFNPETDGGGTTAGLTLGSDGNFYGISNSNWQLSSSTHRPGASTSTAAASHHTTGLHSTGQHTNGSLSCGSYPSAVFFQLTPAGAITFFYCTTLPDLPSTQTPLVQGSDGNFYGISTNSYGSVFFQIKNGSFNVLGSNLPSGDTPSSALAGGPDGKFYAAVKTSSCGSILQFDPANTYAASDFADLDCTNANSPSAWQLFLASDGAFYSSSSTNSSDGAPGSIFRVDSSGTVTYPYDFVSGSGENPYTAPVQNSAGTFFGTTAATASDRTSVIYTLTASPALSAPVVLTASNSGGLITLDWTVNNASSITPPNCVALVNNATGVTGWSGMVFGAFTAGVYSGSATVTQTLGTTANYQIVCPTQGAASISVTTLEKEPSKTVLTIGPSSSMVTGTAATLTAAVARRNNCGISNRNDCGVHSDNVAYPTGTVTFTWNNQVIGQATLSSGLATLSVSTTNLYAQTYSVTASYSGNNIFATSTDTESGTLTAIPTTTTLTVTDAGRTPNNASTITAGNNATLSAQVTAASGAAIPTGSVTFSSGSVSLGSAAVNNSGVATFNVSSIGVPVGTYTVIATYHGDHTHAATASTGVNVVVSKASTITTVSSQHSIIAPTQADQLTATVTSSGDAPTGSVHFLWNNYFICAATLSNGSATCIGAAPSNTAYGPYSITAAYMGDHNNTGSTSQPITVTVEAP